MTGLHPNQQKILDLLLDQNDGATLDEICEHIGVTRTAAKEHVLKLEDMDLLTYRDDKMGVGRPKRKYLLSDAGHEAFPRQYSWLSIILLETLAKDLGPASISRMMKELGKKVALSMKQRFEGKTNVALLNEVKGAMNELGYRSSIKQSDLRKGAVLEATNCVYHSVAKKHPELCQFDIQFLESATGMKVKLESCIARGGTVCRFCICK